MSYDKAAAVIAALNLVPERQDRRSAKEPTGSIISQMPPAGTMRAKKSNVILTVAVPLSPASPDGSNGSSPKGEAALTEHDGQQHPLTAEESNKPTIPETKNNISPEATSKSGAAIVFDPPSKIREAPNDQSNILCSVRQKVMINILAAVGTWYTTDVCPGKIWIHPPKSIEVLRVSGGPVFIQPPKSTRHQIRSKRLVFDSCASLYLIWQDGNPNTAYTYADRGVRQRCNSRRAILHLERVFSHVHRFRSGLFGSAVQDARAELSGRGRLSAR